MNKQELETLAIAVEAAAKKHFDAKAAREQAAEAHAVASLAQQTAWDELQAAEAALSRHIKGDFDAFRRD